MKSLIGDNPVVIGGTLWALSFVRRPDEDHCFLVVEGVDEKTEKRIVKEAHLGYRIMRAADGTAIKDEKDRPKQDRTKAEIFYFDTTVEALEKLSKECEHQCKTWQLDSKEKQRLDDKIAADQKLDIEYVTLGKTPTGGVIGASLDVIRAKEAKQASIAKVQASTKGSGVSVQLGGACLIHALQNASQRHSCVSWAMEAVKHVKPEFTDRSLLSKFIVVPQVELPSPSTGCRLM